VCFYSVQYVHCVGLQITAMQSNVRRTYSAKPPVLACYGKSITAVLRRGFFCGRYSRSLWVKQTGFKYGRRGFLSRRLGDEFWDGHLLHFGWMKTTISVQQIGYNMKTFLDVIPIL